jgi:pimeloyl-ACP methyl ester carboxylesterase
VPRLARLALTAVALVTTAVVGPSAATAVPGTGGGAIRLEPQYADVAGVRTSFAVLGPASPVPLLLLNGTGSPMSQWDPALLDGLSRTRRVVVYDYPGLGASSALPGRMTVEGLATHAAGLLAALGRERADVLGWSMGGFVAQRLAVRFPDAVRSLVLAGTNPGGPRTVLGPAWVQAQDSDADGSVRGYVRTNYPRGARDRGWAFVRRVNTAIDEGRYPPDVVPAATYAAMVAAEDPWLDSRANLRQLRTLTLPVLVITGRDDVVTPAQNSRILAEAVPHASLVLVPDAGHSFLFQQPYSVARAVTAFTR